MVGLNKARAKVNGCGWLLCRISPGWKTEEMCGGKGGEGWMLYRVSGIQWGMNQL